MIVSLYQFSTTFLGGFCAGIVFIAILLTFSKRLVFVIGKDDAFQTVEYQDRVYKLEPIATYEPKK